MQDAYEHKGKPLDIPIARSIIEKHFGGKTIKINDLKKQVDRFHQSRGGLETSARSHHPVVNVLRGLKVTGRADNPPELEHGTWQIRLETVSNSPDENESDTPKTIGSGDGYVYLYYLPNDKRLAELEDESIFACKIGMTEDHPNRRIWSQIAGGLPDEPIIGLVIKTDFPSDLERYIHDVLKAVGRYKEDAPGTEWFFTTPDEVEEIFNALQPFLQGNE